QKRIHLRSDKIIKLVSQQIGKGQGVDIQEQEDDIGPRGIFQVGGNIFVEVAAADGQRQQKLVGVLDLGGEQAGRSGRRGGGIGTGIEDRHGEATGGERAGAGGADDASTDDGDVCS